MEDLVELVDIVSSLEEGAASEEFCEDTPNTPDIN
jgi:hypothetical protein